MIAALVISLAVAALVEGRYYAYWARTCHPPRAPVTAADRRAARSAAPALVEVTFPSRDGARLSGWLAPPSNGVVVIMGHGLGENRTRYTPLLATLVRHGYGALAFDWRAHGESEGDTSTWGDREQQDFAGAVDFALAQGGVDGARVVGMGFSIGASAVACEAAGDRRVAAVILESTWPSLAEEVAYKTRKAGLFARAPASWALSRAGVSIDHVDARAALVRSGPLPMLLIASEDDEDTPIALERDLAARVASPLVSTYYAPGGGHGGARALRPEDYDAKVIAFLDGVAAR